MPYPLALCALLALPPGQTPTDAWLIEFGLTRKIFTTPVEKQTEDYITGRFG